MDNLIQGVFCDICGTLFDGGATRVNDALLKTLREYEKQGKVIHLWTGGNPDTYRKNILRFGINWPILEKWKFEGKTMEIVIDDDPEEKFLREYRIKAQKFISVWGWFNPL